MTIRRAVCAAALLVSPVLLAGQSAAPQDSAGVDPASLRRPLAESWTTYSGDYTGRRFSALTQVNRRTVKTLTLAWVSRVVTGVGPAGQRPAGAPPIAIGVHRSEDAGVIGPATIKGSILHVDG